MRTVPTRTTIDSLDLLSRSRSPPESLQESCDGHRVNGSGKNPVAGPSPADVGTLLEVQVAADTLACGEEERIPFAEAKQVNNEPEESDMSFSRPKGESSCSDSSLPLEENIEGKSSRAKVLLCLALCLVLVLAILAAVGAACLSGFCSQSPVKDSASSSGSPDNTIPTIPPSLPTPNGTSNNTTSDFEDGVSGNSSSDEELLPPDDGNANNIFDRGTNTPSSSSSGEHCGSDPCVGSSARPQTIQPTAQPPAPAPTSAPTSIEPTLALSGQYNQRPTDRPTDPIRPTLFPTQDAASRITLAPETYPPTLNPQSASPTSGPTSVPPTATPPRVTQPTWRPTSPPTVYPTMFPTTLAPSTLAPTSLQPTPRPTTAPPTPTPSSAPSMTPTAISGSFPLMETGTTILLPNYSLVELELQESPQSKALSWLATNYSNAVLGVMPEWRKQQLFAMATLYYALSEKVDVSSITTNSHWLNPSVSECLWPAQLQYDGWYGSYTWSSYDCCSDDRRVHYLDFDSQLNPNGHAAIGGIPPETELLPYVSYMDFSSSGLVGRLQDVVPTQIVHLAGRLTSLSLLDNSLSGTIPTFLAELSNLRYLNLSQNNLSGVIPTQLGLLTKLTHISLSNNQFVGSIPTELGLLTGTGSQLYLNNNDLSGIVPREVCSSSSGLSIDCLKVYCPTSPYSCSCQCA